MDFVKAKEQRLGGVFRCRKQVNVNDVWLGSVRVGVDRPWDGSFTRRRTRSDTQPFTRHSEAPYSVQYLLPPQNLFGRENLFETCSGTNDHGDQVT